MRNRERGRGVIEDAVVALGKRRAEHIAIYGAGLDERLLDFMRLAVSKNSSTGSLTEVPPSVSPVMLLNRALLPRRPTAGAKCEPIPSKRRDSKDRL